MISQFSSLHFTILYKCIIHVLDTGKEMKIGFFGYIICSTKFLVENWIPNVGWRYLPTFSWHWIVFNNSQKSWVTNKKWLKIKKLYIGIPINFYFYITIFLVYSLKTLILCKQHTFLLPMWLKTIGKLVHTIFVWRRFHTVIISLFLLLFIYLIIHFYIFSLMTSITKDLLLTSLKFQTILTFFKLSIKFYYV